MNNAEKIKQIVDGGYCIGCGGCAYVAPDAVKMEFDRYGMLQPEVAAELDEGNAVAILKVCPFSDDGANEDELAARLFPDAKQDARLGRYTGLYAGYVAEGGFRARGSSGGMVSWLLSELLAKGVVDKVLHVAPTAATSGRLFAYTVSSSVEEVQRGAKSKYYPIELSEVLNRVRAEKGRYVLVGVPCFIKAVRRLALIDPVIEERIVFYVGLVCGHLKSKAFADCFAWQAGIAPGWLEAVDFRVKLPGRRSSDYGVQVTGAGKTVVRPVSELFGSNWGYGFFKYSACEYCDDIFAETADFSVGDAWLPEYTQDGGGNSILVVRSEMLDQMIQEGSRAGRLNINECSADKAAESQAGGLRHRRDGLSYRLFLKAQQGVWAPRKRVCASSKSMSDSRRKIYVLREQLRQRSHECWEKSVQSGDFAVFRTGMQRVIRRYNAAYLSFPRRIAQKLKRLVFKR
jgi:coenzyme F420-reducing hydrogenase beta subunit